MDSEVFRVGFEEFSRSKRDREAQAKFPSNELKP